MTWYFLVRIKFLHGGITYTNKEVNFYPKWLNSYTMSHDNIESIMVLSKFQENGKVINSVLLH